MHPLCWPSLVLCGLLLAAGCRAGDAPAGDAPAGDASAPAPADTATRRAAPPSTTPDSTRRESASSELTILVLGNSITAGYGLTEEEAFPALLQNKIDSLGWQMNVVNAGLSGETTAGGLRRLDWLLRRPADVLVVELGGNDGLRGTPLDATRRNLAAIIDTARAQRPGVRILLAGMQIPPNLGAQYARQFRALYPALAEEKNVELVPFLLEGVGGRPDLNQPDGIHPTAEGQRIVAENVWAELKPMLRALRTTS